MARRRRRRSSSGGGVDLVMLLVLAAVAYAAYHYYTTGSLPRFGTAGAGSSSGTLAPQVQPVLIPLPPKTTDPALTNTIWTIQPAPVPSGLTGSQFLS